VSRLRENPNPPGPAPTNGNGEHAERFHVTDAPSGVYDALADLFLGDEAEGSAGRAESPGARPEKATPAAPPTISTEVEGLVLGHLPVLAAAWVTQYARERAASGRTVALVRIRKGEASVDVFGEGVDLGPTATLEDALRSLGRRAPLWLIRVDETDEPRLLDTLGVDRVTLLTGADQAAVVASYRALKSLAELDEGEGPALAIAIMGADAEHADDAADKLRRAAETFLGREVSISAASRQITSGPSVNLFRGDASFDLPQLISALRDTTAGPEPVAVPHPSRQPHAAATEARTAPAPAAAPEPRASRAQATRGAASDAIAGLDSLRPHCPYHPEIELAADADGMLHLVARADNESTMGEAVTRLVATRAWASLHRDLLAMAESRVTIEGCVLPTAHLVTTNARAARRLLDTDVRVHALAPDGRGQAIALN